MSTDHAFVAASRVAPEPTERSEATVTAWRRHYAAQALAAHVEFRRVLPPLGAAPGEPGSRPELGYLIAIAVASTTAAIALSVPADEAAGLIWDLTPEAGALNGEYLEWLAGQLDDLGINPADIDPAYDGADFTSPMAEELVA